MKSFFPQNLSLLRRLDAPLATRMEAVPWPAESATLVRARNGEPALKALAHDDAGVYVHGEDDPSGAARAFVAARLDSRKQDIVVLAGFGLGYVALALAERLERYQWLACIEPRENIFRAALETADLSPLLARGGVRFFVGQDFIALQEWLKGVMSESEAFSMALLQHAPSYRLLPRFYRSVPAEIGVALNRRMVEINTIVHLAENLERNALRNLPAVVRSHGVRDFEGALAGIPAIVVAAGPSLSVAIPHIRRARGRVVVVAVGKALRLLLAEGIIPDFVATLDMTSDSARSFEGLEISPEVALVFDPDAWYGIAAAHKGPLVSYETGAVVDKWSVGSFIEPRGVLEKGLSVAHTAFFFARATGAAPLLLVGVDLAFPGERTHADGVTMTWGGDTGKLVADWVIVRGVNGKPVRSLQNFTSFITAFEVAIAKTGVRVVQTSELGAMIRGAEHISLEAALAKYATREEPIRERIDAAMKKHPPRFDAVAFAKAAALVLEQARAVSEYAENGLRHLKSVRRLDPTNSLERNEYRKHAAKMNAAREGILNSRAVTALSKRIISGTALEVNRIIREVRALGDGKPLERARLEYEQLGAFFEGYAEAARFLIEEVGLLKLEMRKDGK